MNRWNKKRKKWLDSHSRRIRSKHKSYSSKYYARESKQFVSRKERREKQTISIIPPSCFSLVDNTEETMSFFMSFTHQIEIQEVGTTFIVDSRQVTYVTVDALIYLIAILKNDGTNARKKYRFIGNFPSNEEANRVYRESGFTDYVNSRLKDLPKSNEKMRIVGGTDNDPDIARGFCDFVIGTLGKTRKEIMPLQTIFIELMSNVFHHAYEKNTFMSKRWYIYAEHVEDYVRCVFVDTGQGIAKTVRKNFSEWIRQAFGFQIKDSKLIGSAFNGDFRTATKEPYRGNGLNSVKTKVLTGPFERFEVYSGSGKVGLVKDTKSMTEMDYNNVLYGTLFSFIIR